MSGREVPEAAGAKSKALDICVPAFAVGALLATAFFLVFPEAVHLIEGGHSDHGDEHSDADSHEGHGHRLLEGEDSHEGHDDSSESQNAAKFGMAVLGGFLLPIFFGILFPHNHHHGMNPADVAEEVAEEVENAEANERDGKASVLSGTDAGCDCCPEDEQGDVETGVAVRQVVVQDLPQDRAAVESKEDFQENSKVLSQKTAIDYRLIASILVGDFFCNFTDGIFIGAAFLGCSWAVTITIILGTLFHEIPQEMADFLILTRYAGLSTTKACIVNFVSGLSMTLGGVVVLATNTSDVATGIILAIAGGVYINIAAVETLPRVDKHIDGKMDRALMLLFFIVGTVPLGLVLLDHEHC